MGISGFGLKLLPYSSYGQYDERNPLTLEDAMRWTTCLCSVYSRPRETSSDSKELDSE
jgi:hypothetical protein